MKAMITKVLRNEKTPIKLNEWNRIIDFSIENVLDKGLCMIIKFGEESSMGFMVREIDKIKKVGKQYQIHIPRDEVYYINEFV